MATGWLDIEQRKESALLDAVYGNAVVSTVRSEKQLSVGMQFYTRGNAIDRATIRQCGYRLH